MSVPLVNEVNKTFTDKEVQKNIHNSHAGISITLVLFSYSTRKYVKYNKFISLSEDSYENGSHFLVWLYIFFCFSFVF